MIKVAFFSAKAYDKRSFAPFLAEYESQVKCDFFDAALTPETASLVEGHDTVCTFVNDNVNSDTLQTLHSLGVEHLA